MDLRCSRCESYLLKDCFDKNKAQSRGYDYICKSCRKIYLATPKIAKKRKETKARRSALPEVRARVKENMKKFQAKEGYKDRHNELSRAYRSRKENDVKLKARARLNRAVKSGKIQKRECEICGHMIAEAHHHDYSKPLDVVWLCSTHHKLEHAK